MSASVGPNVALARNAAASLRDAGTGPGSAGCSSSLLPPHATSSAAATSVLATAPRHRGWIRASHARRGAPFDVTITLSSTPLSYRCREGHRWRGLWEACARALYQVVGRTRPCLTTARNCNARGGVNHAGLACHLRPRHTGLLPTTPTLMRAAHRPHLTPALPPMRRTCRERC